MRHAVHAGRLRADALNWKSNPQRERSRPVVLQEMADVYYRSSDGSTIRREDGKTPDGRFIAGHWVYRDASGKFIDMDQYRYDLAERNGLELKSRLQERKDHPCSTAK